ncbi:MAG: hypothetical protein Q7U66_17125 [Methylobacter sp.]|nr:hypothetical protein [Methylobacter sp.]
MQTYLPFIKAMLSEWYLFTLNNALYAAVLATAVWLLTAILYSVRIAAIKREKAAGEKAAIKTLNDTHQQLQLSQEELTATVEQMEKAQSAAQAETQRALALEQLIYQRNRQIAGTIQTLATSFDLGERPLLASEDVKADSLWQQHDKVIMQLIERLRTEQQAKIELQQTCQAATTKLAEKESLLNALKSTLDNHTNQLSKLEQALEEQKSILQQQNNSQQALSDTLKNFQPAVTRPVEPKAEPKPETFRAVNNWQQPMQAAESPTPEDALTAQPAPDKQVEQINEGPQASITRQVEETPIELVTTVETAAPVLPVPDIEPQPADEEDTYVSLDIEQQPVIPAKGSLGKIKNLFGKKQQSIKTEPQWTAAKSDETLPSSTDQQPDDVKTPGKLKGFYSKFRSKDK